MDYLPVFLRALYCDVAMQKSGFWTSVYEESQHSGPCGLDFLTAWCSKFSELKEVSSQRSVLLAVDQFGRNHAARVVDIRGG